MPGFIVVARIALLVMAALVAGCSSSAAKSLAPVPAPQNQERHTESGWFCHRNAGEIDWMCEPDTSSPANPP